MTWELRQEERESVSALPAPKRYSYLIKKCADWEEVWGLSDAGGWVTASDDEGQVFMPIWPHPEFARACAAAGWEGAEPEMIELDEWMEEWLPKLEADQQKVSAFPLPDGSGVPVEPQRLREDLATEAEAYE